MFKRLVELTFEGGGDVKYKSSALGAKPSSPSA